MNEIKKIENPPWLDIRLTKEAIDHLWDRINNAVQQNTRNKLAGNISKSVYLEDKNNWLYENILKMHVEYIYFSDWPNYYNILITKSIPPPVFKLDELWVNYQKQYEFNPPHQHFGAFSFVVFMKIPTHWKEQHALPFSVNSNTPCASDFMFVLGQGHGPVQAIQIPLSPEDEGRMLFFPAWLSHQVLPFYGTEEERITVSGNIIFKADDEN